MAEKCKKEDAHRDLERSNSEHAKRKLIIPEGGGYPYCVTGKIFGQRRSLLTYRPKSDNVKTGEVNRAPRGQGYINTEQWSSDDYRGKHKKHGKCLLLCHFIHRENHMKSPSLRDANSASNGLK
jgi:hypothetical protein